MIKFVSFDLDGTILDDNSSVANSSIDAIVNLMKVGIVFSSNSGRSVRRSQEPLKKWPDIASNLFIGAYNGGVVVDRERNGNRKLLYVERLSDQIFEEISLFAKDKGLNLICCMFEEKEDFLIEEYRHSLPSAGLKLFGGPGFVHDSNLHERISRNELLSPPKVMIVTGESERDSILQEVRKRCGKKVYATWSIPDRIEIMPPNIDKSQSLRALVDLVDVRMDEVLAIGDGENDIPMLEAAGFGVLMGNAETALKCSIKDSSISIGPSITEDGFSATLREYIPI